MNTFAETESLLKLEITLTILVTEGGDRRSQVVWVETYAVTECGARNRHEKRKIRLGSSLEKSLDNLTFRSTVPAGP